MKYSGKKKSYLPILLALFFGLAVLINLTMFVVGYNAPPPLVRDDYYEAGLAYAEAISESEYGAASGITFTVSAANPPQFLFFQADAPISSVTGIIEWYRPNDPLLDFVSEIYQRSDGKTRKRLLPGRWDATVAVSMPTGLHVRFSRRLYLPSGG